VDLSPHPVADAHVRQVVSIVSQDIIPTKDIQFVLIHEKGCIRTPVGMILREGKLAPRQRRNVHHVEVHGSSEDVIKLDDTARNQKLAVICS
jgi:glycerophosphoryl diester phosphodiesterase